MTKRRQRGEGALFQRASDGLWVGRVDVGYSGGKRRQKTVYGRTQTEARRKLRDARAAVEAGDRTTAGQTLDTWLDTWLDEICPGKPKMRPRTIANYRSYANNYLRPCLGRVRVDKITPRHIRELHRFVLNKGLSTTTAGHAHSMLATVLHDAVREGILIRNPSDLVPHPPSAPSVRRALSVSEVRRVCDVVEPNRLASRWHTAFLLGMRPGECLGLTWDCVDLQAGTLDISWQLQRVPWMHGCGTMQSPEHRPHKCPDRQLATLPGFEYRQLRGNLCLQRPKTRSRVVPIPLPLHVSMMQRWIAYGHEREHYREDFGLVWCEPDGRPIEPVADRANWHAILSDADVDDTDLYSARHTTATLLLAMGVSEDVRMAIMGHTVAQTTRGYTHVDLTMLREALSGLGEKFAIGIGQDVQRRTEVNMQRNGDGDGD